MEKIGIPGKKCGAVILSAEELSNCRVSTPSNAVSVFPGNAPGTPTPGSSVDNATMQFCANKLDKKDFFGKSDPFMVFYRSNEDGTFTICHKTEVVKNTLNPVWQSFTIPVRALCNGDYDRTIKVEVYDWDRDGRQSGAQRRGPRDPFVINSKKKMKKKKYANSGTNAGRCSAV
ncbi:hypothetical protein CRUP_010650 [Coryphaenoides rupestris]|nr:hypothetical protein CRUP_010650 [Coryphaenoides rupestris]